jgi:hypothetical protein
MNRKTINQIKEKAKEAKIEELAVLIEVSVNELVSRAYEDKIKQRSKK